MFFFITFALRRFVSVHFFVILSTFNPFCMDKLSIIKQPIEQEFVEFNKFFEQQFKSDVNLLNNALFHVCGSVGKMMRPMLVLLIAKSIGEVNEKSFAAAAAMELLHTASLLHDDVIDESDKRRGRPSVNAAFNNNVAVLAGDFLFSQALNNAALTGDCRVVEELSTLGKALSKGEILQFELQQNGKYNEEQYLKVISCKTASLFRCCSACAVYTAAGESELLDNFNEFAHNIGLCFQIKDDIFDYYSNDVGKPTGSDMREGKITLPALYVLEHSNNLVLKSIKAKLESGKILDEKEIESLIAISVEEGGVEYAWDRIEHYRKLALDALPKDLPSGLYSAFMAYIDYVISREK